MTVVYILAGVALVAGVLLASLLHGTTAARCQRTRPPILRLSWQARPEAWCPSCGRPAPAPDTRAGAS